VGAYAEDQKSQVEAFFHFTLPRPTVESPVGINWGQVGARGSLTHLFVSPKQELAVAIGTNGLAVLGVKKSYTVWC
jgi:hypothetical protein